MSDESGGMKIGRVGVVFRQSSPIFIFAGIFILMSIASPYFFAWRNFMNVLRQSAVIGILAMGQALVIMTAGIDLSVGSMMTLSGCLIATASTAWGLHPVIAVATGVSAATLVGLINGFLTAKVKLYDFIATLGTKTAIDGVALLITDGLPVSKIPPSITVIGGKAISAGIPIAAIVFALIAAAAIIILGYTTFGRNALAIGGNSEAARVSGVDITKTKIMAMAFCGLCSGIGGIVIVGRLNSANALMGTNMELNSIAAVVIGGTSINGGQGTMFGTIIGVLTMGVLQNGLELLNISSFWQKFILGLVIIAVVTLDTYRRKKLDADRR
ncbi:MAG: ABC transporter permease [Synergistaceae bacterium]|jgi:ribose/xylose/arabinose/galactoside ABC-type transport system permease subunit|nr:ABC transporter permease [Synergistaceae bacterium]